MLHNCRSLAMPSMVHTPRSYASSARQRPILEIVTESRFLVFNGSEHEATSARLRGVVRLTTPDAMSIMKPRIRLEGKRKITWFHTTGMSPVHINEKSTFWEQEAKLGGIESSHKIKAGVIEWPFEFELSPAMPESVEGLRETFVAYHLHASVSRPGWNAKDITTQDHIRLVRTLGQESMETTRSRVNADIWANKISYSISIPTDAIVFGTSITADVELSPIKKGIRLGKVELRLLETVVKRVDNPAQSYYPRSKTEEMEVAKEDMDFPEDSRVTYDESVDNPTMADEAYKFQATLPLPKSLNDCRQDVDAHNINITHRFKLMVNIHNPEGHISQLVCRLPVKLFISPNLPVDETNQVCPMANGVSDAQLNSTEMSVTAPPEYGRHQLDQMYRDIDPSGFMSRAGSGPGTPAGLYAQSRRGSHENIMSLNGLADGDMTSAHDHGSAMPHLLHSRLANLQERDSRGDGFQSMVNTRQYSPSGGNSPAPGSVETSSGFHSPERGFLHRGTPPVRNESGYFSTISHSPHVSAPMSRRASDDGSVHQQDYDMDGLARVPSYGAALRTPGAVTPFTEGPPSYLDATSRPPSPVYGIRRPGQAHVRDGSSTPNSQSSQHTLTTPFAALHMTSRARTRPVAANRLHSQSDEDARLKMLRARA